ncbi:MAG: glutathione transferase GstA [Porticoccaceae bacterium]
MKLFYSPGACSLSPHIALREAGLTFDLVKVDLKTKTLADGGDFNMVNPKGYVPVLQLDDGQYLAEGPAIVQYIADQKPESGLAPKAGTLARYRLQEWLTFINSELHKGFSTLFNAAMPDEAKALAREALSRRLGYVAEQLKGKSFLMGDQFTVADGYLYTVLGWCGFVGLPLDGWPVLVDYSSRVKARPSVQEALAAERASKK